MDGMTCQQFVDYLSEHLRLNPGSKGLPLLVNGGPVVGLGINSQGVSVAHDYWPQHSERSSWDFWEPLFKVAKIPVLSHYKLANQYWPETYVRLRDENPWWLVKTPVGLIQVGWRKRVAVIDWSDTPVRQIITEDQVTKDLTFVHCYPGETMDENILRYLRQLSHHISDLTQQTS